ncbi:DUF2283 domain-containing protein [Phormidium tenue]|uniref:DUF2283 domain-containing protein n=1 Tax=Phormidium tenue NIES-30 TaxID=549789 RepID=A0A1U7J160_9CYAN|nr:DUF2283 domain-containing protein [Phormidium tenue]MBD2233872.1 DUF2283 domain-containing protein [Phormidium tenue FACHB-1052]OKH45666.1 hypothetical protein NIES30_19260 [Phormidium tenue NIES-30]
MRIQYFPDTDTLSIRLNDSPSVESEEIAPDVVVDFDEAGSVVGLEIDLASAKVDLKNLDLKGLLIPELAST